MGLDDFEVLQPLGKGAFARVDKVKRKADGKVYALKRVDIAAIPQKDLQDSLNEIRILASFKHPRLIRWYETFIAEGGSSELCIVMEYCPYGDLEQKIKRHQHRKQYIDEREIWVYAINILEGLAALHAKGVVHRDLKPANCLIDPQGCVKIADMNISKVSKGGNMQTQVGTPYFICPEIYLKRPYSSTSDMWSLGGVLYNLAALHPPFLADNIQNLRKAVVKGTYDPLPSVYGASLATLIGRLLQLNPADRPEAKDILADPLIERHRYLLLHPLPPSAQEAEGEMLPTIKIASDKEGVKTIALPGPAYDDETGAGTPRSPTSVVVVYSPRSAAAAAAAAAKEKDASPTSPTTAALQKPRPPSTAGSAAAPAPSPPPAQPSSIGSKPPPPTTARPASVSLARDSASARSPPAGPGHDDDGRPARPTSLPFGGLNLKDFKSPAFKSPFAAPATAAVPSARGEQPQPAAAPPQRKSPGLPFSLTPLSPPSNRNSHHEAPEVASDGFLAASPPPPDSAQQQQQQQDQARGNKRSSIRRILDDMEQRRLSGFVSGASASPSPGGGSNLAPLADDFKRLFTRSPTGAGATAAPAAPAPEGAPTPASGSGAGGGGLKWPGLSPKAK